MSSSESTQGSRSSEPSAAQAFERLWAELVDVLGTGATATLVRRAAKRACTRTDALSGLQVVRTGWEYKYALPSGWEARPASSVPELVELVRAELAPLLREFTGEIVLRRVGRVRGLEALAFPVSEEK